jgi:ABC-type Fe3+ transport system permease subunit
MKILRPSFHLTLILRNILLNQLRKEVSVKQDNHDSAPQRQLLPARSTGQWALALFALTIPLVSIIILIVWAFRKKRNPAENAES